MEEDAYVAAAAFRGTEEYAAAFDIEVWKAQQRARLRNEISEEKARLQRAVAEEVRKKEAQRISELDSLQQELQQLARRLQLREEALQKRISQFEVREAIFEDRRVKVAEQHEQHLLSLETRTRRQREEASAQVDVLRSQLVERDRAIALLEERLAASEAEYDKLQRCMSRIAADEEDKSRVSALEEQLSAANSAMDKLQLSLKERDTELAFVSRERDELKRSCELYKDQLHEIAKRYSQLQQQCYRQERRELQKERSHIEDIRKQQVIAGRHMGVRSTNVHRYDLLSSLVAEQIASRKSKNTLPTGCDDSGCQTLLRELKSDVVKAAQLLEPNGKRKGSKNKRRDIVCAEVPPAKVDVVVPCDGGACHGVCSETRPEAVGPLAELSGDDAGATADTTVSSLSHRDSADHRVSASPVSCAPPERYMEQEDLGDLSSMYCYADVEPWLSDGDDNHNKYAKEAHREYGLSDLPPLAPATAPGMNFGGAGDDVQHRPMLENFAELSGVAPLASSRDSTRKELVAFVEKLRDNRRKLLESGVYDEDSSVVKGMTEKIALYEDVLSQRF